MGTLLQILCTYSHFQTPAFNGFIMFIILLNALTIAMETTSLSETVPLLFTATDNIFLGIYILEFVFKVSGLERGGGREGGKDRRRRGREAGRVGGREWGRGERGRERVRVIECVDIQSEYDLSTWGL